MQQMADLALRAMSDEEFAAFREATAADYAEMKVRAGEWERADATRLALEQTDQLLPDGANTPGMLLVTAQSVEDGAVGRAWVALSDPPRPGAWIYAIEVAEAARGKGYGRALLAALEDRVRERGVATLGLNVFGENQTARRLYESAGYATTSLQMRKIL